LELYLIVYVIGLRWFFDMVSEPWWLSDHEFESHHPHLFDKNQAQDDVSLCKFSSLNDFYLREYVRE